MNSPSKEVSAMPQVQRRSPRLAKATAPPAKASTAGCHDRRKSIGNTAAFAERAVGASGVTPRRGRQGRRSSTGCRSVTPVSGGEGGGMRNVSVDDGNMSFRTAEGEASPGVGIDVGAGVDHAASIAKSNLFESFVSDASGPDKDPGNFGSPPASCLAVANNDSSSTLVKKMSSLTLGVCAPSACDNSGIREGTGVDESRQSFSVDGERVGDVSMGWQKPPSITVAPEEHRAESISGSLQPPSPAVAPEEQRPENSRGWPGTPSSCIGPEPSAGCGSRRTSRGVSIERQKQQGPRGRTRGRSPVTRPRPPSLVTMQRAMRDGPPETSEEAEIRKQNAMREQLKMLTRRNQLSMERNSRTVFIGNVRSSQPLTVPEGPAMKTASRLGEKVYSAATAKAGQDGTHSDKDHSVCSQWKPKGPTVPEPFHLSASNRPGSAAGTPRSREECFTFREHIVHMETKVPDRFIKKPSGEHCKPAASAPFHPKPTVPRSPRFLTEQRAAVNKSYFKTPDEREKEDLAYMKKHQFKARRYSADNFGISGEQGVICKHHSDKPLTKQEPFRLSTGIRSNNKLTSKDDGEISNQFKARPMPGPRSSSVGRIRPGSRQSPERLPNAGPRPLTVAESPTLSTMRRSVLRSSIGGGERMKSSEEAELEKLRASQFKARPMPDYVKMGQKSRRQSVNPAEKSVALTETKPFNLRSEERGKAKQALLEQRLVAQRKQEEAATRVRARPLPSPTRGFIPQRSSKPLTETEDFHLSSEARHERAEREFQEKIRREEEEARLASKVTALPLPISTFEPEPYPGKTEVSLTQPEEVMLHSSVRAQERAQWDRENDARLETEKRERRELEEAITAAEKRQIEELRRRSSSQGGMAFKAKPIPRTWNPPEGRHLSTAPLTTPITPNLRTMRRARNEPYDMP